MYLNITTKTTLNLRSGSINLINVGTFQKKITKRFPSFAANNNEEAENVQDLPQIWNSLLSDILKYLSMQEYPCIKLASVFKGVVRFLYFTT